MATKFTPDQPVVEIASVQARKDEKEALSPIKEKCGYLIFILVTAALIFQSRLGVETWVICFTGAVSWMKSLRHTSVEKSAITFTGMQSGHRCWMAPVYNICI